MNKYPAKPRKPEMVPGDRKASALTEPARESAYGSPFFSFRYSYKEVSLSSGKALIRSIEHRFEDGKLASEAFEGTTDERLYHDAVRQTQAYLSATTSSFLRLFSAFLPSAPKSKDE